MWLVLPAGQRIMAVGATSCLGRPAARSYTREPEAGQTILLSQIDSYGVVPAMQSVTG